jgi:hypothetical protein
VDDVLYAVDESSPIVKKFMKRLKEEIQWGSEKDAREGLTYCGRHYVQDSGDFTVKVDMIGYAKQLSTVEMSRTRRAEEDSPLTPKEHRALRGLGGQVAWLGRQGNPRPSFRASRLAKRFATPTVRDFKEANAVIRLAKKLGTEEVLTFSDAVDIKDCVVMGVQDAAFDNIEDSGSQGGKMLFLATKRILTDPGLTPVVMMEWASGRIRRVVRSTLAAEAYIMGENGEGVEFLRSLLAELFMPDYTLQNREKCEIRIPGLLGTDARALHDNLRKEGGAVRDRRLRLELNLVRSLPNVAVKWIRSEMMVADELTKELTEEIHSYARLVRQTGLWTLADDTRAPPSRRKRALVAPDKFEHQERVEEGPQFCVDTLADDDDGSWRSAKH